MSTPATKHRPLTRRQRELVETIKWFCRTQGAPPTMPEAAARMGTTAEAVGKLARRIVARGYLTRRPGIPRGIVPVDRD